MTNQQGAPEARCQACIDRHDGFYGSWAPDCLRHNYDGTLRSATHVQNPAEIEHVAGDVSKNSTEKNMTVYAELPQSVGEFRHGGGLYTEAQMRVFADATHALRTQQPALATHLPAPSAAAQIDSALNDYAQAFVARVNGWTKQNGDDLPVARAVLFQAITDYARELAMAAPQPSPTPQADSQPVLDEATAMNRTRDLAESGRWPSDWVESYRRGYSDRAANAPADSQPAMTPETVYAAIAHGDEEHRAWLLSALRAVWCGEAVPPVASPIANAAADSQPAPVRDYPPLPDFETVEQHIYGACRRYITQDMLEPIHNLIRDVIDADRAARAPTSSVLEDATRYRFIAGHCRSTSEHWGGRWSIIVDGPAPKSHDSEDDFDEAVDAARAKASFEQKGPVK